MSTTITLYQYHPCWDLLSASPFCMKTEVFLKLNRIDYQNHYLRTPQSSPTKKLPYIKDGDTIIYDSSNIITHLTKKHQLSMDQHLSDQQRSLSTALQRMIEEHLYWSIVYSRWIDPNGWPLTKKAYFGSLPPVLKSLVPALVKRGTKTSLYHHGMGRLTPTEIYQRGIENLTALHTLLAAHPFLLNTDAPTSIDASAYAFIENIRMDPITSPLKDYVKKHAALQDYCLRMEDLLD